MKPGYHVTGSSNQGLGPKRFQATGYLGSTAEYSPAKCREANPIKFTTFEMTSKCRLYSSGRQRVGLSD
jgi:hypothetical protein